MRAESSPDIGDVPPAESASVAYEMLDVPVVVDVEAREARARLKAANASVLLDEIPGTPPVRAALRSADSGSWTAAHEDWTTEPAPLVETVRALNHRLLHAVMRRRTDLFYVHAGIEAGAYALLGGAVLLNLLAQIRDKVDQTSTRGERQVAFKQRLVTGKSGLRDGQVSESDLCRCLAGKNPVAETLRQLSVKSPLSEQKSVLLQIVGFDLILIWS